MKAAEARGLGARIQTELARGNGAGAYRLVAPLLQQKIPYRSLDLIAAQISADSPSQLVEFFDYIAAEQTIGGWVVIASALRSFIPRETAQALDFACQYVIESDVWYGCDSIAERVHGPALVEAFDAALSHAASLRAHPNRWIRRSLGVGIHVWAKRSTGDPALKNEARRLLAFLEPLFGEGQMDAVKGVGWALKTLGRFYPDLLAQWLPIQIASTEHRRTMVSKAITYLPPEVRQKVLAQPPA